MPSTIGIDTGGTFTDLVAISGDGSVRVAKHPSTPEAPMRAFLGVLEKSEIPFEAIERIVHGTTVATNAILQRPAQMSYLSRQLALRMSRSSNGSTERRSTICIGSSRSR